MAVQAKWDANEKLLHVQLDGLITLPDFITLNKLVNDALAGVPETEGVALLIDASAASMPPTDMHQLRRTQTFVNNAQIKHLIIVTPNKITRLTMLLAYNLSKPQLRFFDTLEQAVKFERFLWKVKGTGKLPGAPAY